MKSDRPDFMDSTYFVGDKGKWHLKEGAPAKVVKEFNDYMEAKTSGGFVPLPRIKIE